MTITNKKLIELLNQFPDESLIFISNDDYDADMPFRKVHSVSVEYFDSQNYEIPEIVIN